MAVSIKIERERKMNILLGVKKKWLSILIEERKFPKNEMCHLNWDKLKKNVSS